MKLESNETVKGGCSAESKCITWNDVMGDIKKPVDIPNIKDPVKPELDLPTCKSGKCGADDRLVKPELPSCVIFTDPYKIAPLREGRVKS